MAETLNSKASRPPHFNRIQNRTCTKIFYYAFIRMDRTLEMKFTLSSDVARLDRWSIARDLYTDDECNQKNAFLTVEKNGTIDYDTALKNSGYNPAVQYINLYRQIDGAKLVYALNNVIDIYDFLSDLVVLINGDSSEEIAGIITDIERAILHHCCMDSCDCVMSISDYLSQCGNLSDSRILQDLEIGEVTNDMQLERIADGILVALDSHLEIYESKDAIVEYLEELWKNRESSDLSI